MLLGTQGLFNKSASVPTPCTRGVERLACYAFACPPCMEQALAAQCAGFVLSMAFRDDVVTRFSPQSLAALNTELRGFDLEGAKTVCGLGSLST